MYHSAGEWGLCSARGLPTPAPSCHPSHKTSSLGGRWCVQEPGLGAALLVQDAPLPGHKRTCLRCVSSPRSRAAAFDLPVFCLAGSTLFPCTLPEAVQTVEWAGRSVQGKYSRRHPVGAPQAQHSWSGRVGIHAPAWILSPDLVLCS